MILQHKSGTLLSFIKPHVGAFADCVRRFSQEFVTITILQPIQADFASIYQSCLEHRGKCDIGATKHIDSLPRRTLPRKTFGELFPHIKCKSSLLGPRVCFAQAPSFQDVYVSTYDLHTYWPTYRLANEKRDAAVLANSELRLGE